MEQIERKVVLEPLGGNLLALLYIYRESRENLERLNPVVVVAIP